MIFHDKPKISCEHSVDSQDNITSRWDPDVKILYSLMESRHPPWKTAENQSNHHKSLAAPAQRSAQSRLKLFILTFWGRKIRCMIKKQMDDGCEIVTFSFLGWGGGWVTGNYTPFRSFTIITWNVSMGGFKVACEFISKVEIKAGAMVLWTSLYHIISHQPPRCSRIGAS